MRILAVTTLRNEAPYIVERVAHHQNRIAHILGQPEGYELYCNILLAAEGPILPDHKAREMFQLYQKLQHGE
ncbi:hypothetical protein OAM99_05915 [Planktomarina sp.]|nr:hypothetical protein [Planktomarina sp.]